MKTLTSILAITSVLATSLPAESVPTETISKQAKWLIHLNLDAFRDTAIGAALFESVIKPKAGETPMGFRIKTEDIYQGIHAITAYGNSYQIDQQSIGVLLIRTEANLRSILEAALIQQEAAGAEGAEVKTIQTEPYPIYSVAGGLFGAVLPSNVVVVSKSLEQLTAAVDVVENRSPGLDERKGGFPGLKGDDQSFFLLATAEGFNESNMIPPQARVLQLAESARLALGEIKDRIALNLTLGARDETTRTQLQKIVEGLLALVSLGQLDNQDLSEIVSSTEVMSDGNDVSVGISYPVDRVLALVQNSIRPPAAPHHIHEPSVEISGDNVKIQSGETTIEIKNP
ncbi:MAG: hypothetical protein R3F07_20505 [Opitutaceae bacterium]